MLPLHDYPNAILQQTQRINGIERALKNERLKFGVISQPVHEAVIAEFERKEELSGDTFLVASQVTRALDRAFDLDPNCCLQRALINEIEIQLKAAEAEKERLYNEFAIARIAPQFSSVN